MAVRGQLFQGTLNVVLNGVLADSLTHHLVSLIFTILQGSHKLSLLVAKCFTLPSQLKVHISGVIRHASVLVCSASTHSTGQLSEVECLLQLRLAEVFGHLPLILILTLLSAELHEHISALAFGHHVSPLGHVLSVSDYLTLLVNSRQVVIHAPHGDKLLL